MQHFSLTASHVHVDLPACNWVGEEEKQEQKPGSIVAIDSSACKHVVGKDRAGKPVCYDKGFMRFWRRVVLHWHLPEMTWLGQLSRISVLFNM